MALDRQAREYLAFWPAGEERHCRSVRRRWADQVLTRKQLEEAQTEGYLERVRAVLSQWKTNDGWIMRRTSKVMSVRPAREFRATAFKPGKRQEELLLLLAERELHGKAIRKLHLDGALYAPLRSLEKVRVVEERSVEGETSLVIVNGTLRDRYLRRAAVKVLIDEGTRREWKAAERAASQTQDSLPDKSITGVSLTAFKTEAEFTEFDSQVEHFLQHLRAFRTKARAYFMARANIHPTKEEAAARVVTHQLGVKV